MRLIKQSYQALNKRHGPLTNHEGNTMLMNIERAGRICYMSSEDSEYTGVTLTSAVKFCDKLITRGHLSVIEHETLSVKFVLDRGVSHELVRHRICSFSQESTRYCDYQQEMCFIIPVWCNLESGSYARGAPEVTLNGRPWSKEFGALIEPTHTWLNAMWSAEEYYKSLRDDGWSPEKARSVLPCSLKTEILVTANLREWRHILNLRCAEAAHPQMRDLMIPLLCELRCKIPVVFAERLSDKR